MERNCGGCMACCKTHAIFEIKKPRGEWCPHCDIGKGCKIYAERPGGCQGFKCVWLMGVGGPDYRPDKIKIVPEYRDMTRSGVGITIWFWELREDALSSKIARSWTRRNLLAGNCVMHIPLSGSPRLYLSKKVNAPEIDTIEIVGIGEPGESRRKVDIIEFPESAAQFV